MSARLGNPRLLVGIGLAVAAAIVAVLLFTGGDDSNGGGGDSESAFEVTDGPEPASLERLRDVAGSAGHPVYWAGPQDGNYELTIASDGSVFIRYLPEGVPVGSRQVSLTVGTYPYPDAFGTLHRVARQPGAIRDRTPDGGFVVATRAKPSSVYVAYPGKDFEIEVYDPDADRALEIATSGAIGPIE